MLLHGGRFENYYSRSTVTHIICSNLTDAKVKIFQKERCSSGNVARLPALSNAKCIHRIVLLQIFSSFAGIPNHLCARNGSQTASRNTNCFR